MCLCTNVWTQLRLYLAEKIDLLQSAIFGFVDVQDQNDLLLNHVLIMFKRNIYSSRLKNYLNFQNLISGIKCVEEALSYDDNINKKWKISNK